MRRQIVHHFAWRTAAPLLIVAGLWSGAAAQSMSPMRGEIKSFSDAFALKVVPSNPYPHRIRMEVRVYDQDFHKIEARVSPSEFTLGSLGSRPVTVVVPFDGDRMRKVRVCAESVPFPNGQTQIKAQICGKFLARRLSPF